MAKIKKQKGISIVYIVLITSFIFAIAVGINTISYQQAKTMTGLGYSVVAFFAADAGAEKQLNSIYKEDPITTSYSEVFASSFPAGYSTTIRCAKDNPNCVIGDKPISRDDSCRADNFCVNSVGNYLGVRRAVELKY